jgi:2,3-bisphosphoglycerate-dependent phosphoglycerate mutase
MQKKDNKATLILMRHGQSLWNLQNIFTGWVDIPLSEKGIEEAVEGGKKIKDIPIDMIFTSTLIRAHMTLYLAMLTHSSKKIPVMVHTSSKKVHDWEKIYNKETAKNIVPVISSWHLNERMYGKLQGQNKDEMRRQHGKEQVKLWRRSFHEKPPEGESLEDTANRTLPYFNKEIVPHLDEGKNIFISAHGNSLRSIVMRLDDLSEKEVVELELATGEPIVYTYSSGQFQKE